MRHFLFRGWMAPRRDGFPSSIEARLKLIVCSLEFEMAQLTTAQAPIRGLLRWMRSLSHSCHPRQETQPHHQSDKSFL